MRKKYLQGHKGKNNEVKIPQRSQRKKNIEENGLRVFYSPAWRQVYAEYEWRHFLSFVFKLYGSSINALFIAVAVFVLRDLRCNKKKTRQTFQILQQDEVLMSFVEQKLDSAR